MSLREFATREYAGLRRVTGMKNSRRHFMPMGHPMKLVLNEGIIPILYSVAQYFIEDLVSASSVDR